MRNGFFSLQLYFGSNLYSTYVVKIFLVGISILGRRGRAIRKIRKKTLKVKWRLGAIPQAYEFTSSSNSFNKVSSIICCSLFDNAFILCSNFYNVTIVIELRVVLSRGIILFLSPQTLTAIFSLEFPAWKVLFAEVYISCKFTNSSTPSLLSKMYSSGRLELKCFYIGEGIELLYKKTPHCFPRG